MAKIMILNGVEEKALKQNGFVVVKRKGFEYLVQQSDNGYDIKSLSDNIVVVCPLDLPTKSIIITHEENKELNTKGQTTHTKGGVTYNITKDLETQVVSCSVACEYDGRVLFASEN